MIMPNRHEMNRFSTEVGNNNLSKPDSDVEKSQDEDSPYPEVRSAVANTDDPSMPASTFRAWVLGIFWAILLPGMNQFFYLRYPSVTLGGLAAQLLVFPVGRAWARFCPNVMVFGIEVNPGPFNIKEHVLVTIMATVGAPYAYATDIIAVQRKLYNQDSSFIYRWLLVTSTQLIGFSIGGIVQRFLVSPASMIWPNTLVSCALFNTLHSQIYSGIGQREGISREKFFTYVFIGAMVWYFFPGYIFQALSTFTWACWIAPDNVKINQLFGYKSGLGFSLLTFDWNQIAFAGRWAEVNVMIGFFILYWLFTPIVYYTNVWFTQYMPISSTFTYDNTGKPYNVTLIIGPDGSLDEKAYQEYSPLYIPAAFLASYGISFLAISAIIYFWKPIRSQLSRSEREQPDVHARLMKNYPRVPEWYYACVFAVTFMLACVTIEIWSSGLPVWALLLALFIAILYIIPIGMIQAMTNRQVGLNVITELIIGFLIPVTPLKTYGYITMSQDSDKVPPRAMFWAQIVATLIAGTVQLLVQAWMFDHIPDLCDHDQKDNFVCAGTQVFGTASIIWGVVGPRLLFANGHAYLFISLAYTLFNEALCFFFIIGAACPVIIWLITRWYPNRILGYINLIFTGVSMIPPATAVNYVPWAILGFLFQFVVRRRHFSYWAKYNYVLSAALDVGTAFGVILVYFCLQYPLNGRLGFNSIQQWWGNQVFKQTTDWQNAARISLQSGETFGFAHLFRLLAKS
ncbi:small oligopeptide transporter [Amanita muscaria]